MDFNPIFYFEEYLTAILRLVLPIAGFAALVYFSWKWWMRYINTQFIGNIKWKILEIRIPQEVFKSPLAMELVLQALYQTGGVGTWINRYWDGAVRLWFSLELVSIEGKVFFFIRTPEKFKELIESYIYAQYPQAEVSEVEDYALRVPPFAKDNGWSMHATEFKLTKPDPYPIKTYVDYELDKAVGKLDENERVDPITPMLEYMGSLNKGEQLWLQYIVRADTKRFVGKEGAMEDWKKEAAREIDKIREKYIDKETKVEKRMSKLDQDIITALERSMDKLGFDTGIRGIYIAKKENFNGNRITGLMGMFRQFNSQHLNAFAPQNVTGYDYVWQDLFGTKVIADKAEMLEAYRARGYFYSPFNGTVKNPRPPFILNSEELATIYHFPGRVLETPSFKRIDSKKVDAPENLPI